MEKPFQPAFQASFRNSFFIDVGGGEPIPGGDITPASVVIQTTVAFSQQFTATGGVGPYTYAVTAGAMPTAHVMSAAGLETGTTPDIEGTAYSYTLTATDSESNFTSIVVSGTVQAAAEDLPNSTILSSFSSPSTAPSGLAFDGTNLISCDDTTNRIYIHTGISSTITTSFAAPSTAPNGLTFDGANLISCDPGTDTIYVHVGTTSSVSTSFASPASTPTGLAFDGTNLISCDQTSDLIYTHDGVSSAILSSFTSPATSPRGLAVDTNGNLISCDRNVNTIYVHDGISAVILRSFASPSSTPTGLTHDGTNLLSTGQGTDTIYTHDNSTGVFSRYVRVLVLSTEAGSGTVSIAQMEYRSTPGGANIATGGTAAAGSTFSSNVASNAFDGVASSRWQSLASPPTADTWLSYDLGSSQDIAELTIKARSTAPANQSPASFTFQTSVDNAVWVDVETFSGYGSWAIGETKVFTLA